jgi:GT2 family glycosyltransferase
MNISIIIPNYNGEVLLKKNLPKVFDAVKNYKNGNVEIIIPNDPSTDNSKIVIESFLSSLQDTNVSGKTVENTNKKESGFAKNVNRGVTLATGDILILLNSDVVPHKDFLAPLLMHFSDEKVFAVGCMDESHEGNRIVHRGRGIGSWQRGFLMHKAGELNRDTTLWASGGSSAFRKTTWDLLQGLDPLYNPFYWEDIDLSYRALKSGYKVIFEQKSIVTHAHDKGAIKTEFKSNYINKIAYRNQFIFIWKNITDSSLLVNHILWLPYHILKAILRNDKNFILGFFEALLLLPKIINTKSKIKKLFRLQDKNIIASVMK